MKIVFRTEAYSFLPIGFFEVETTTEANEAEINAIQGQYGYFAKIDGKCQSVAAMKKRGYILVKRCEIELNDGTCEGRFLKPELKKVQYAFN